MRTIEVQDLEAVALGGAVYGTGGGGDPYLGKLLAQNTMRQHGPVRLIDVESLADDALVVSIAGIGAPTVLLEKMPNLEQVLNALAALESALGRRATAIMSAEVGGLNSTIPFCAASARALPLVDGDTMGRAFPEIQMTLCTLHGIAASPLALGDEKGNAILVDAVSNKFTERFVRSITTDMGGSAMGAMYSMSGAQARRAVVRGSISKALETGRAIFDARAQHANPVQAAVLATGGFLLYAGKVVDVERGTSGGFSRGLARIVGLDGFEGEDLTLRFQNEFLLASRGGQVLVSTPDLIVLLDLESGEPVTGELLRYGLRVAVLGIPCVSQWRSAAGLALVGPHYFGYEADYVPVEQRQMSQDLLISGPLTGRDGANAGPSSDTTQS
jgi:DUF917 family protein